MYARTCFVEGINRLIREESVGNVSVCQFDTRFECRIRVSHVVVVFVTILDVAKDLERFFRSGRFYDNLLETAFKCSVLFDILAVFVEGSSSDALDFSTCQGWFQHISGIHGASC